MIKNRHVFMLLPLRMTLPNFVTTTSSVKLQLWGYPVVKGC